MSQPAAGRPNGRVEVVPPGMQERISSLVLLSALITSSLFIPNVPVAQAATTLPLIFPFLGGGNYWNDFGVPRDGGARSHEGNDIFPKIGEKHAPVLAVANGTISWIAYPERPWGMSINLRADDGYEYRYLHLNNDRPGTDDGSALPWFAYAPDISSGSYVRAGQVIGYNGDSGNAEHTGSHIHFEMRSPSHQLVNPFDSLSAAQIINAPLPPARQNNEILPYRDLPLGANVALGQLDEDSALEIIIGPLAGGGPHVRTFDDDAKSALIGFFAYQKDYPGGVDVAAGDLDGDGIDEIITGAGPGGTAHVRAFTADGEPYGLELLAFPKNFLGGVRLAAADLDGDGIDEIIVGAGAGNTPLVRVFDATGTMLQEWTAYNPGFLGGIDVAATDGTSSVSGAVITGPGAGGGPHVKIFDRTGELQNEFLAYDNAFTGGVHISARVSSGTSNTSSDSYGRSWWWNNVLSTNVFGLAIECIEELRLDAYGKIITIRECTEGSETPPKEDEEDVTTPTPISTGALEIFTIPASGGTADIRRFDGRGQRLAREVGFDSWWVGGFDIAASPETAYISSGLGPEPGISRRTSVRLAPRNIRQ